MIFYMLKELDKKTDILEELSSKEFEDYIRCLCCGLSYYPEADFNAFSQNRPFSGDDSVCGSCLLTLCGATGYEVGVTPKAKGWIFTYARIFDA